MRSRRKRSAYTHRGGTVVVRRGAPHRSHRDGLVVVAAAHRAHDVCRNDAHDERSASASAKRPGALGRQKRKEEGGSHAKPDRHHAAHVVEGDGIAQRVEHALDDDRGDLHSRVDGRAHRPTERIPGLVIEPVEELVPTMLVEILRRAVVEPRIELVDHVPVPVDGIEPNVVRQIAGEEHHE